MSVPTPPEGPVPPANPGVPGFFPQPPAVQPEPPVSWGLPAFPAPAPRKSSKHWYFGVGGLVSGVAIGLVFGLLMAGLATDRAEAESEAQAEASAVAAAQAIASVIPSAVEKCSATNATGVEVMDKGKNLSVRTSGKKSSGTTITTVVCVLNELDAPDSLYTKLESTRALDGTQSADWPGFTASWTYHPDNGLNIIVETAAN